MAQLHRQERGLLQGQGLTRRTPLDAFARVWLLGAALAAGLRVVTPYEHGIWLVAYLFLVGFAAQLLLGRGQRVLRPRLSEARVRLQTLLWNAGVIAVPAGVLLDVRLLIAAGTVVLLLALASFARAVAPAYRDRVARARSARPRRAYAALWIFMLASALVGFGLSSGTPWLG